MKPLLLLSITLLSLPMVIFAQERVYQPLVNLGNATQGNNVQSFEEYINFLYGLSIAIAALLAVIKIVIAGAKYMLSSVISAKGDALEDIRGAIVGLLVILSAVLILEFINPKLVNKNIQFEQIEPVIQPVQPIASGEAGRQQLINNAIGTTTVTNSVPTVGIFSGIPVYTADYQDRTIYVFDSSYLNNSPTTRFEREADFKRRCTNAEGVNSKNGSNIFVCTIRK